MTAFFLDIPHIADAIVFGLSPSDLRNCRLVNHAWHDALISLQWHDAVLLRKPGRSNFATVDRWHYADKRQLPEHDQILVKRAQYIRTISIYGTGCLALLTESGCTSLRELCFVVEHAPPRSGTASVASSFSSSTNGSHKRNADSRRDQGLDDLAKLVLCNPQLRAISIQNVGIETNDDVEELMRFVKFLDHFPSVTAFHLGFSLESLIRRHLMLPKILQAILDHRLDLVNDQQVHHLQICRRSYRRADRGLAAPATGAESGFWCSFPKTHKEQYMRMDQDQSLAVIENNGLLELVVPLTVLSSPTGFRLRHYPQAQSLSCREVLEENGKRFLKDLSKCLPGVQAIDIDWADAFRRDMSLFVHDSLQPASVSIRCLDPEIYNVYLRPWLGAYSSAILFHGPPCFIRNSLVRLSILGGNTCLDMNRVLELLEICPRLQHLDMHRIVVTGAEPDTFPLWVCQLRTLSIGLGGVTGELRGAGIINRVKSFMERVAEQTTLEELTINFDYQQQFRVLFPGTALCLDEPHGLILFAHLIRLKAFTMLGIDHCVEREAVEWMAQQWPRLQTLGLPYVEMANDDYEDKVLAWWPTESKPNVEFMEHWY